MQTRRLRCVGVLVVVVTTALGACSDDDRERVLVVGDSVTRLVADELDQRDGARRTVVVRAANNATAAEMRANVEAFPDRDFDQVVVNLGTNDALRDRPFAETEAALASLLARFDAARCVHLTTVNEQVVSFEDSDLVARIRRINEHLRAVAASADHISIIDWSAAIDAQEGGDEQAETDAPLLTDTVHPTAAGQTLLISLYRDAINRCAD
jgi:lysophospholipase L1-like esterase